MMQLLRCGVCGGCRALPPLHCWTWPRTQRLYPTEREEQEYRKLKKQFGIHVPSGGRPTTRAALGLTAPTPAD